MRSRTRHLAAIERCRCAQLLAATRDRPIVRRSCSCARPARRIAFGVVRRKTSSGDRRASSRRRPHRRGPHRAARAFLAGSLLEPVEEQFVLSSVAIQMLHARRGRPRNHSSEPFSAPIRNSRTSFWSRFGQSKSPCFAQRFRRLRPEALVGIARGDVRFARIVVGHLADDAHVGRRVVLQFEQRRQVRPARRYAATCARRRRAARRTTASRTYLARDAFHADPQHLARRSRPWRRSGSRGCRPACRTPKRCRATTWPRSLARETAGRPCRGSGRVHRPHRTRRDRRRERTRPERTFAPGAMMWRLEASGRSLPNVC